MDYKVGDQVWPRKGVKTISGIYKEDISYIIVTDVLKNIENLEIEIYTRSGEIIVDMLHYSYLKHLNTDNEQYSLTF